MTGEITLLLVDDDEVDRQIVKKSLKVLNAQIEEAYDCSKCLEMLQTNVYDLILLDYKLPDCNGIDLAKEIRAMGVQTPVILVTGFGSEDLVVDASEVGFLDYVPKDKITPEFLTRTVLTSLLVYRSQLEKKQAEEDYKNLYDLAPIGLCRIDLSGKVLKSNLLAASLMGFPMPELIVGHNIAEWLEKNQFEALIKRAKEIRQFTGSEYRLPKRDLWVSITGKFVGTHVDLCIVDITNEKRLQEEVAKHRKYEIERLQEVQQFVKERLSDYSDK